MPRTTGCAAGTTTPSSASPPGRSRPSRSSSRPTSCCGEAAARAGSSPCSRSRTAGSTATAGHGPYALLGVRSCDLHAIAIHDRVLAGRVQADAHYAARREDAFIVAVSCTDPGGTCFCVSMGTGPRPEGGRDARFDLSLTELLDGGVHRFLVEVGSERGRRGAGGHRRRPRRRPTISPRRTRWRAPRPAGWAARWTPTGSRSCCTRAWRVPAGTTSRPGAWPAPTARWSARPASAPPWTTSPTSPATSPNGTGCGTPASTPTSPTSTAATVRDSTKSRYRQWMTHKLGSWIDQFGTSGLRRLRPVRHLVPRRHRHHRRGGRAPRSCRSRPVRSEVTTDADHRAVPSGAPVLRRTGRPRPPTCWPAAPSTCTSGRASSSSTRATPADHFYVLRHGRVAIEVRTPGPRRSVVGHGRGRGRRRLVVAGAPVPLDVRRPRRHRRPARSPSTRPACGSSARPTRVLGYDLMHAVRHG